MSQEEKYKTVLDQITKKFEVIRKSKKLTQKDVAFSCDMEEQNYRRIEKGQTNPTLKSLVKICMALDIDIKELF